MTISLRLKNLSALDESVCQCLDYNHGLPLWVLSSLLFSLCAVPFFNESDIRFRDAMAALLGFDVGSPCAHSARSDRPFNSV